MVGKRLVIDVVLLCGLAVAQSRTLPSLLNVKISRGREHEFESPFWLSIPCQNIDRLSRVSQIDASPFEVGKEDSSSSMLMSPLCEAPGSCSEKASFTYVDGKHVVPDTCLADELPEAPVNRTADRSTNSAERASKNVSHNSSETPQEVQWKSLLRGELLFLATMHSYRIATEGATREALQNRVWSGYFKALAALHGWSDGDGYYETYLGHPIQGAVAGYMWIHNDPKYRVVEFGKSRDYWMSRMRAYAWSYVEIEQFKVGLLSEATVGQISRYCCAYGFNDHVITSNGGLVWIVGEDAIDRYIVRKIEDHTHSVPLRILARVGLNPPQGMANLMNLQYPWYRENRAAPSRYNGDLFFRPEVHKSSEESSASFIPKFEAIADIPSVTSFSNLSCVGGNGVLGFHMTDFWQWSGEVGGCMLLGQSKGWSGDSLTFMMGPQWIWYSKSRWASHVHLRVGGQKITEEHCQHYGPLPTGLQPGRLCQDQNSPTYPYAQHFETTCAALSTGAGVDLRLSRALSLRLADLSYVHTWVPNLNGTDFSRGLRFSIGVGLQVGTW